MVNYMLTKLSDNVFYNLIKTLIIKIFEFYRNSNLHKLLLRIKYIFQNSYIAKRKKYYEHNTPIFVHSKLLKFINKIIEKLRNFLIFMFGPIIKNIYIKESKICIFIYKNLILLIPLFPFLDILFRKNFASLGNIWDELFLIIMFFICICKLIIDGKKEKIKNSPFDMVVAIFIIIMFVLLFIDFTNITVEGFRAIVQSMLWYFIVFNLLKNSYDCKKLIITFSIIFGFLSIHGIYQYIIGVTMPAAWISVGEDTVRTRVFSIFNSPNIFGSVLVMAIPICISLFMILKNKKVKIIFLIFSLCMCFSLLFTYSKGAWIGAICAIGVYILLKNKKLIIPGILALICIFFLVPGVSGRIIFLFSPTHYASSMKAGRMIRWINGFYILQDHPWVGLGLGRFGGAVAMNNKLTTIIRGRSVDTFYMDNYYMKIAVESGIIGLVSFVFLMWQVYSISLKTINIIKDKDEKNLAIGIMCGLIGVMVHCFVENIFEVPMMGIFFWSFVACLAQMWYSNYRNMEVDYVKD